MEFTKPACSEEEHLRIMEERGLLIPDHDKVIHYLKYIGYYRLTGYCLPFQHGEKGDHTFLKGTSFDDVLGLYIFDRKLRLLVLDAIEEIEVAFRAVLSNTMSLAYGPHWYLDRNHFGNRYGNKRHRPYDHEKLLKEIDNTDNISLRHYRSTYSYPEYPPSWIVIEVLSFGTCSILFAHLRKRQIALASKELGLEPKLLVSWMQGLVVLRNLCAHHGRLWNWKFPHTLSTRGKIPEDLSGNFAQNNTFYEYACLIMYFLKLISPKTTWANKLSTLITEHKSLKISDMGFPEDWKDRIIWKNFL